MRVNIVLFSDLKPSVTADLGSLSSSQPSSDMKIVRKFILFKGTRAHWDKGDAILVIGPVLHETNVSDSYFHKDLREAYKPEIQKAARDHNSQFRIFGGGRVSLRYISERKKWYGTIHDCSTSFGVYDSAILDRAVQREICNQMGMEIDFDFREACQTSLGIRQLRISHEFTQELKVERDPHLGYYANDRFSHLVELGGNLFAGTGNGKLFMKKDGEWAMLPFENKQAIRDILPASERLLVNCSGKSSRIWAIAADGSAELTGVAEGQNDQIYLEKYGLTNSLDAVAHGMTVQSDGNVLLAGYDCHNSIKGGRIYHIGTDGKWEMIWQDKAPYLTGICAASNGSVYVIADTGGGFRWNEQFLYLLEEGKLAKLESATIGMRTPGDSVITVSQMMEYNGKLFMSFREGGNEDCIHGCIQTIELDGTHTVETVWSGHKGGVNGFFLWKGMLHAWAHINPRTRTPETVILRRDEDGKWAEEASIFGLWALAVGGNELYALGEVSCSDSISFATINLVHGL
jgi:hypothetical protein